MCGSIREDADFLDRKAEDVLNTAYRKNEDEYDVDILKSYEPILNRIIKLILTKNNISPSSLRINEISGIIKTGGKINIAKNKFAVVKDGIFKIETIFQEYRNKIQKK
jgi:hypothetical protein